jgi:hypothetical protein
VHRNSVRTETAAALAGVMRTIKTALITASRAAKCDKPKTATINKACDHSRARTDGLVSQNGPNFLIGFCPKTNTLHPKIANTARAWKFFGTTWKKNSFGKTFSRQLYHGPTGLDRDHKHAKHARESSQNMPGTTPQNCHSVSSGEAYPDTFSTFYTNSNPTNKSKRTIRHTTAAITIQRKKSKEWIKNLKERLTNQSLFPCEREIDLTCERTKIKTASKKNGSNRFSASTITKSKQSQRKKLRNCHAKLNLRAKLRL